MFNPDVPRSDKYNADLDRTREAIERAEAREDAERQARLDAELAEAAAARAAREAEAAVLPKLTASQEQLLSGGLSGLQTLVRQLLQRVAALESKAA